MKKLIVCFVAVIGMITSAFATDTTTYTVIYGKGIDTLQVKAGDTITSKSLVFHEKEDQFTRGDAINGIVPFSSHGFTFWVSNPKMSEDTLAGTVALLDGIFSADPNVLLASNDHSIMPDENEKIADTPWYWQLIYYSMGIITFVLIFFVIFIRRSV